MDGEIVAIVSGVLGLVVAIVAIALAIESRTRARDLALRDVKHLLDQVIAQKSDQTGKTVHLLRPGLPILLTSQWRFIEKVYRYRFEKSLISKKIAGKHIPVKSTVLLDSGSTTDLVTSELLLKPDLGTTIYSNNVFAAIHLVGSDSVPFFLLSGKFNERFAAVYSDEAINRLDQISFDVFILATMAIDFQNGIMVHKDDIDNHRFKQRALELFRSEKKSRLIVAVDASKFCMTLDELVPILPSHSWKSLCEEESDRMTIVTTPPPLDLSAESRVTVQEEIANFRNEGIFVDDEQTLFEDADLRQNRLL